MYKCINCSRFSSELYYISCQDCYDEETRPAGTEGKIMAIGAPAEVLQKLHTKPPPPVEPTTSPLKPGYGKNYPWDEVRLPKFAKPTHYKLLLQPDMVTGQFKGTSAFLNIIICRQSSDLHIRTSVLHKFICSGRSHFPPQLFN
jgi:hypothetical protein